MFFRRDVLEELGGFNINFGMVGNKVAYEDETEILHRLRQKYPGNNIYYDPDLWVYHTVRPEKMKLSRFIIESFNKGRYKAMIGEVSRKDKGFLFHFINLQIAILKIAYSIVFGLFSFKKLGFMYFQQYFIENVTGNIFLMAKQLWFLKYTLHKSILKNKLCDD